MCDLSLRLLANDSQVCPETARQVLGHSTVPCVRSVPNSNVLIMFYLAHVVVYIGFFNISNFSSIFSILLIVRRLRAGELSEKSRREIKQAKVVNWSKF